MFYSEFPPPPALAPYVRGIWAFETASGDEAAEPERIVPDGHPELLLHYGDRFQELRDDGSPMLQSRALFAGQISQPLLLKPGRPAGVIGIRFHPAGARALLGLAMHEVTDVRLDMTQVWGRDCEHLLDGVHSAHDVEARVQVVGHFLRRQFTRSRKGADPAIAHSVGLLHSAEARISVDALARQCGMSARQIERRFLDEVGVPPRLLASIFRFRRVFDLLEEANAAGRWASTAISAGYFDQAHMIRDFKRFAGQPPQAFYNSLHGLSAAMVGGDARIP